MKEIYLDNAATTKVKDEVIDIMIKTMNEYYANADSTHNFGMNVAKKIKEEKNIFKKLLGIDPNDVYFTAGGGDANNILVNSIVSTTKKGRIITTKIEHPSLLEAIKQYDSTHDIVYLKVDKYGFVDKEDLKSKLTEDTVLVSIAYVNSELGTVQDIEELSKIVKSYSSKICFHTDFVQGLLHFKVNFSNIPVDSFSISSHKIYGPKGIGALYLKKGTKFRKTIYGSNSFNELVPRTLANELVRGFLKALSLIDYNENLKMMELKEYAKNEFENLGANINSPINSSPSILNIAFKNARGEIILNYLSSNHIYISTGSACSSKKAHSEILKEVGLSKEYLDGVLRISFSSYNTKEDIDMLILKIKEVLELLR